MKRNKHIKKVVRSIGFNKSNGGLHMWLFSNPKDYNEMVEKISKSVFFITLFLVFIFSISNTDFYNFLISISFGVEYNFNEVKFSVALFYIPLIIGIIENIFKLHDKVSDIFGIRKRFNRKVIVNEFLNLLSIDFKLVDIDDKKIQEIMSIVFYKYTSSTSPEIDSHYIHLALGSWCWFWIFLDTLITSIFTGVLFLINNFTPLHLYTTLLVIAVLLILMYLILLQSKKYAKNEVQVIIKEHNTKDEIGMSIRDALQN